MKVFVTGATGFVGRAILKRLHESGHSIRILARHPQSARVQTCAKRFAAEIHRGDVTDGTSLADCLRGCDAVIHLVGIISEVGDRTYENVHTLGTQNIVAAAQAAGVKRFIHMSALGTRQNAIARYHKSKWAAEEIVRGSGLDFTIFRPSIIYGPDDMFVNMFAKMARLSPILPVMGDGQSKFQPIPVNDVATCFVGALTEPKSTGQTYDLCGLERLTFDQVLDTIFDVMGKRRWKLHLPLGIARVQATLFEFLFAKLLRKPPPLNRDQLVMLQEDNVGDPRAANELFGLRPIPFRDGIAAYLKR